MLPTYNSRMNSKKTKQEGSSVLSFSRELSQELGPKQVRSEIFEIQKISLVLDANYLCPETWVIFDLDETIMETVQALGSDQWFNAYFAQLCEHYKDQRDGNKRALCETVELYNNIHKLSNVKAVEEDTVKVIAQLHSKYNVLALTARGAEIEEATLRQLTSLGVLFDRGIFKDQVLPLSVHPFSSANNGIIFAAGQDKGRCLKEFLEKINCKPSRILFVDDKLPHVKTMQLAAVSLGIEYVGLHYTHLSNKAAQLHLPTIKMQLDYFNIGWGLVSDEEARALIEQKNNVPSARLHA